MRFARASILLSAALGLAVLTGCTASVPVHSDAQSEQAKQFAAPSDGKAGLYVYRDAEGFGGFTYRDVYLDGVCLGETAPGVFFYTEIEANKEHTLTSPGQFTPYEVTIYAQPGKTYFVEQRVKWGVLRHPAPIREVEENYGKQKIMQYQQAVAGNCSVHISL